MMRESSKSAGKYILKQKNRIMNIAKYLIKTALKNVQKLQKSMH